MAALEHPGVRKVLAGLAEAGLPDAAAGVLILPADVRTAAAAAAAIGVEVGAIANSLVFRAVRDTANGTVVTPLLVMTSGAHRADEKVLAELAGVDRVGKADAEFVRTHTGQPIGGVAPIGHPEPIPTIVDRALAGYPVLWAAAGHPKSVFPLSFADLTRLTQGRVADVSGRSEPPRPLDGVERGAASEQTGTGRLEPHRCPERSGDSDEREEASASQRLATERRNDTVTGAEDDR